VFKLAALSSDLFHSVLGLCSFSVSRSSTCPSRAVWRTYGWR